MKKRQQVLFATDRRLELFPDSDYDREKFPVTKPPEAPPSDLELIYGPVISFYGKADAIRDGLQLALSGPRYPDCADKWVPQMCREAGFRIPVYMTTSVWHDCVNPLVGCGEELALTQDAKGRLWDILNMLRFAIRGAKRGANRLTFELRVVRNCPAGKAKWTRPKRVTLLATCGGDDDGSPCITICYPDED